MKRLTVTPEMFADIILGLIQSGVTFDAVEKDGKIEITFTGGF